MNNLFTALSDTEIDQLDNFLLDRIGEDIDTKGRDEGVLGISELDGLFTAVASGPVMTPPSQWLPVVWGDFEPEWNTVADYERIATLLMRHMNTIAGQLLEQPDDFDPIFMEHVVEDKAYTIVDEWCEGYSRGIELTAPLWDMGNREMKVLLTPILAFTSETNWRGHEYAEEEIEALQNTITPNVRLIHAYWLMQRDEFATATPPEQRSETSVGRNDPCPCGIGMQYKKCCLH